MLLASPWIHAQDSSDEEEEVFELSPFVVDGSDDQGYRATSTLAGTRIRTDLKDVGSSISVYTEEFLKDIGATDNNSLLTYTTATEVAGVGGNFAGTGNGATLTEDFSSPNQSTRVRGLDSADNARNYFLSSIPWDGYNVSRVDMQRGPNAILFGLGSPAGIINVTTDQAGFKDDNEISLRFDSNNSIRFNFNLNRVLIEDELSVRVAGVRDDKKYRQQPAYQDNQRFYTAFRYEPKFLNSDSSSFKITGSFETGQIESNKPRSVTPQDRITAFFNESGAVLNYDSEDVLTSIDYPLTAGTGGWIGDPYGVEDQSGDYGLGENRLELGDGGILNPNYLPAIGNFGQNYGGPLTVFPDSSTTNVSGTTVHEAKLYGGLNADGSIDNTLYFPYGRLTSIDTYTSYADQANLPYADAGVYKNIYLQDETIFDYWNNLIDGPNKREWYDFDTKNLAIEQTFFDNKLGYELSFYEETLDSGNLSLMNNSSNIAIFIDTNTHLGDGSENPNLGRAFISDSSSSGNSVGTTERDAMRFTAFTEYDFREQGSDGWLSRLLGKQRFSGMYSDSDTYSDSVNFRRWMVDPSIYDELVLAGADSSWNDNAVTVNTVHYLGDSLLGQSSASGSYLPGVSAIHDVTSGTYYSFDATWNATGVDPSAAWTTPVGDVSTQSENPDNYVGWTSREYPIINALTGNTLTDYRTVTGASMNSESIESEALVWQGYFWDGALVGTYGWRKDTDTAKVLNASDANAAPGVRDTVTGHVDVFNSNYDLALVDADVQTGQTQTWSAVLHLNRVLNDRLPLNVSLYYNESENFRPAAGRVDLFGEALSSPKGSTEERSILLSTKDNRYSLKVTDYETRVSNISSGYIDGSWFLGGFLEWGTEWANVAEHNISDGYTLDGVWDPSDTSNSWRYDYDGEAEAIAGWRAFTEAVAENYPQYLEAWSFNGDINSDIMDFSNSGPSGLTYTQDGISRGQEYEFTANPTENWRIAFNATRTEAVRENVGGAALIEWIDFVQDYIQDTPAGDVRIWWAGGPTIRDGFNSTFYSNYSLTRLLEGNSNPEVREWRFNMVNNYAFKDGMLKGVNLGMGYRWEDEVVLGYPVLEVEEGVVQYDIANPYYGPSLDHYDFWIGYERPLNDKINWRMQFNLYDAFADKELIPISVQPNGDWAGVRLGSTTTWSLSNTFTF
ncbi:TonB-dependent receptor plug domain protein [Verrucomicrobiia bacterium DG1235]|nr:TonB-dependent receptor plug domain protein [Verrucomicrobiae bacterium DG1235]